MENQIEIKNVQAINKGAKDGKGSLPLKFPFRIVKINNRTIPQKEKEKLQNLSKSKKCRLIKIKTNRTENDSLLKDLNNNNNESTSNFEDVSNKSDGLKDSSKGHSNPRFRVTYKVPASSKIVKNKENKDRKVVKSNAPLKTNFKNNLKEEGQSRTIGFNDTCNGNQSSNSLKGKAIQCKKPAYLTKKLNNQYASEVVSQEKSTEKEYPKGQNLHRLLIKKFSDFPGSQNLQDSQKVGSKDYHTQSNFESNTICKLPASTKREPEISNKGERKSQARNIKNNSLKQNKLKRLKKTESNNIKESKISLDKCKNYPYEMIDLTHDNHTLYNVECKRMSSRLKKFENNIEERQNINTFGLNGTTNGHPSSSSLKDKPIQYKQTSSLKYKLDDQNVSGVVSQKENTENEDSEHKKSNRLIIMNFSDLKEAKKLQDSQNNTSRLKSESKDQRSGYNLRDKTVTLYKKPASTNRKQKIQNKEGMGIPVKTIKKNSSVHHKLKKLKNKVFNSIKESSKNLHVSQNKTSELRDSSKYHQTLSKVECKPIKCKQQTFPSSTLKFQSEKEIKSQENHKANNNLEELDLNDKRETCTWPHLKNSTSVNLSLNDQDPNTGIQDESTDQNQPSLKYNIVSVAQPASQISKHNTKNENGLESQLINEQCLKEQKIREIVQILMQDEDLFIPKISNDKKVPNQISKSNCMSPSQSQSKSTSKTTDLDNLELPVSFICEYAFSIMSLIDHQYCISINRGHLYPIHETNQLNSSKESKQQNIQHSTILQLKQSEQQSQSSHEQLKQQSQCHLIQQTETVQIKDVNLIKETDSLLDIDISLLFPPINKNMPIEHIVIMYLGEFNQIDY